MIKQRTLVISDIHGAYRALTQVLDRANYNSKKDKLIFLGDVCDGWKETSKCVDFLSTLPNFVHLLGNHDDWTLRWLIGNLKRPGEAMESWEFRNWNEQGGQATLDSMPDEDTKKRVYKFLSAAKMFHKVDRKLFVHGGIAVTSKVEDNTSYDIMWDRSMIQTARMLSINKEDAVTNYDEVFCGHTPTFFFENRKTPFNYSNVWLIDTGASYTGCLSVIDADTKKFWQSDPVPDLYPGETAR